MKTITSPEEVDSLSGKMDALVKEDRKKGAKMRQVSIPSIQPHEVLIEVKAASICGTDLHIYQWDEWASKRVHPPYIFGHEMSGVVVEVGEKVTNVGEGDQVSCETHIVCGECSACLRGEFHICYRTEIIGVDRDGCFAEYVAMPAQNVWKNHNKLPFEVATLMEPMGNAVHAVLAGPIVGKQVAVVGCGPIGLMAIAVAKAAGALQIIALDLNPYRLRLAERMGATEFIRSDREDPILRVEEITKGKGIDVVLEMSGHPVAVEQAFAICANGGRISLLGLPARPVSLNVTDDLIFKGVTVYGITGRKMFQTWEQTAGLLESGRVDVSPLITHRFPLSDFEKGFALMQEGRCGKVVFCMNG